MAQNNSTSPYEEERRSATQLGKASYQVSVAGIITGVVLLVIYLILHFTALNYDNYH